MSRCYECAEIDGYCTCRTNVPVAGIAWYRTAPRRTVTIDRAVVVAALDAWQQYQEIRWGDAAAEAEWDALAEAMAELNAEVQG